MKKYVVRLTGEEREICKETIDRLACSGPLVPKLLDGEQEAQLIALRA